ncbi:hypothetical protein FE79_14960, partial [Staphylococcus aureus]
GHDEVGTGRRNIAISNAIALLPRGEPQQRAPAHQELPSGICIGVMHAVPEIIRSVRPLDRREAQLPPPHLGLQLLGILLGPVPAQAIGAPDPAIGGYLLPDTLVIGQQAFVR